MQIQQLNRADPDKIFITVENAEGSALEPNFVCEWTATTTDADQGRKVELVDSALQTVTGLGAATGKVAGVVTETIATGEIGRLQVWGPAQVRVTAAAAAGTLVMGGGTPNSHGIILPSNGAAGNGIGAVQAIVGTSLESVNATNAMVQLHCM